MRARKKAWTEKELATNERFVHNPTEYKGRWKAYFANNNPLHIELGCGKGRFVTQTAVQNPNVNYIAIEREPHVIVTGARAARELDCHLAFIVGDAEELEEIFAPAEVQRIYINFCDPWPNKNKWAKRRLTYHRFLESYKRLMGPGGQIFFKTDNAPLFEFSLNEFSDNGWRLKNISFDLHQSGYTENIMTEYEEKFSSQGLPIYRCEAWLM